MSPPEFMQRLAALVVPQGPASEAAVAAESEVQNAQARPNRISWAGLLKRVFSCDIT